jgi:sec-independent protein translocase protein TatB
MGMPPTIQVASLGMWDSLILMVMALVVFGPRRLPEIGRKMGRIMYELRKASNDFKFQMEEELRKADEADLRKKEETRLASLTLAAPAQVGVDSQVPESGPGAPSSQGSEAGTAAAVANAPAAVESPYPGEDVYPPVIADLPKATAEETLPAAQIAIPAAKDAGTATSEPPAETPVTEQARHD